MRRYVLRRLLLVPFILFGMTVLTFAVTRFVPTDPVVAFLGTRGSVNQEAYDNYVIKYGLDKTVPEQYLIYVSHVLHGDFGKSTSLPSTGPRRARPVLPGHPRADHRVDVRRAGRRHSDRRLRGRATRIVSEQIVKGFTMVGISTPTFVAGLIFLQVFYLGLGWAAGPGELDFLIEAPPNVTGMVMVDSLLAGDLTAFSERMHHIALPASMLGLIGAAFFARVVR